jgi:aryl-alcohol dehydrogenase-like predicted oxidoreductase
MEERMTHREYTTTIQLGPDGPQVRPLGIGTRTWGYREDSETDRQAAFDTALGAGVTLFDTAEIYAMGKSERLLGKFIQNGGDRVVVMTKYAPFPWRLGRKRIIGALRRSLKRLNLEQVDHYMVHWPYTQTSIKSLMNGLADAVEAGLTKSIGVSNFSGEKMQRAFDVLDKRGLPLIANQVKYSLLHRDPECNGLLDLCKQLDVILVAYAPLASGLLTGKYLAEQRPGRLLRLRQGKWDGDRLGNVIGLMREIGEGHGGKTAGQVALNWIISQGAVPIPGAKNRRQAEENTGALGWSLTESEMVALDITVQ